jgi:hypothetical protein
LEKRAIATQPHPLAAPFFFFFLSPEALQQPGGAVTSRIHEVVLLWGTAQARTSTSDRYGSTEQLIEHADMSSLPVDREVHINTTRARLKHDAFEIRLFFSRLPR